MRAFLTGIAGERLAGNRPSPVRAVIAAAAVGAVAAGVTYRALRS
jgi:hypothetical protein